MDTGRSVVQTGRRFCCKRDVGLRNMLGKGCDKMNKRKRIVSIIIGLILCIVMLHPVNCYAEEAQEQVDASNGNIRVLIKTTNFAGDYHSRLTLVGTKKLTISNGKKTKTYAAGKKVTIKSNYGLLKGGKVVTVKPQGKGKTKVTSIQRNQGIPVYRGTLTIRSIAGKGLALVNQVPVEEYLYSVVGSEMSPGFSEEALKAQAICARSFAYAKKNGSKYASLGADLDDSTSYQVYNNCAEDKRVINAVDATKDLVIKGEDSILETHFFSTSFGVTALPSELWGGEEKDKFYRRSVQNAEQKTEDLSKNEEFMEFLENTPKNVYDRKMDMYRWSSVISKSNLQKQINSKLGLYSTIYPANIKKLQKDGSYKTVSVSSVGTLKNIKVVSRTPSGMVKELQIEGSSATVRVSHASAMRVLLAPVSNTIKCHTGRVLSGYSMLPSSYFAVEKSATGGAVTFTITGGGYGHNVGMSQNGANEMAKEGKDYEKILLHYYKNVQILNVSD